MAFRILVVVWLAVSGGSAWAQAAPVTTPSAHSVAETEARLVAAIEARGMRLFTIIDHQAAAAEAGLEMPAARVVFFGMPAAGTPMFVRAPTLAIDLPLRVLVFEDAEGAVFVAHNPAAWMASAVIGRHGLAMPEQAQAATDRMLGALVEAATAE